MKEINKRILTGFFLIVLLYLSFLYPFILIISLILISIISWIEFNGLISKIFIKNIIKINFLRFFFKLLSLIYFFLFSFLIFDGIVQSDFNFIIFYLFLICIFSDIGGFIFGKTFKGKKLTKISPNKTISGSVGSFILPLVLIPIFNYLIPVNFDSFYTLIIFVFLVSFACQLGDLFISFLKRKARVKDTGDLLPGHGGFLDRIDGILLAVPIGIFLWKFLLEIGF